MFWTLFDQKVLSIKTTHFCVQMIVKYAELLLVFLQGLKVDYPSHQPGWTLCMLLQQTCQNIWW